MKVLLTFITFQVGWFLLILGHQSDWYLLAFPLIVAFLLLNKVSKQQRSQYFVESLLIVIAGVTVDFVFSWLNLIQFGQELYRVPVWLVLMWLLFAITFDNTYRWLNNKIMLGGIMGGIFGPAAYWAAAKLSDVAIMSPIYFTVLSAVFWSTLFIVKIKNMRF